MHKSSRNWRKLNRLHRNHSCNNCKYFLVDHTDATWAMEESTEIYCDNPITKQYQLEEELDCDLLDSNPMTCGGYAPN